LNTNTVADSLSLREARKTNRFWF